MRRGSDQLTTQRLGKQSGGVASAGHPKNYALRTLGRGAGPAHLPWAGAEGSQGSHTPPWNGELPGPLRPPLKPQAHRPARRFRR